MKREKITFDCELIGLKKPVFLVRTRNKNTGVKQGFWWHKKGDMKKLHAMFDDPKYIWESFNGIKFDAPLIAAAIDGHPPTNLKQLAQEIIENKMQPWEAYKLANCEPLKFDHIDLIDVAPGVMTSLKTYMARMHYPTLVDMPFHHDTDLKPSQLPIVESYCDNDTGGTALLGNWLSEQLALRVELGEKYGLDLRSKSDAQVAEAIIKKVAGIAGISGKSVAPSYVEYHTPAFIKTKNKTLINLIEKIEAHSFKINYANGSVIVPDWMEDPVIIGKGSYKVGVGGLHSTHDLSVHRKASADYHVSDFDVASYYPAMILKCGYVPRMTGNKGQAFLDTYRDLYEERLAAKRASNKKIANTLKIALNGTFGKLGNIYSAFYSPDLMLAVTITGQLNLLCLIEEFSRIKGVEVISANTDGICLGYTTAAREKILKVIAANAKRTSFEYEETPYNAIAMKDVNNYLAVTTSGKVKAKGLYAEVDGNPQPLMKNPTMAICSKAAAQYLIDGTLPKDYMRGKKDIRDFVSVRGVTGGGVQHKEEYEVDDWVLVMDVGTKDNLWMRQVWLDAGRRFEDQGGGGAVRRKSRPAPVVLGRGGVPFGRVARWYMTKEKMPAITYVGSGNKVPKTEGAKLLMTLPPKNALPPDIDIAWYVKETCDILADIGCTLSI